MKNRSQGLILLKKNLTMILTSFDFIFAFALSHRWRNYKYSKANKAIGLKFSGNVKN